MCLSEGKAIPLLLLSNILATKRLADFGDECVVAVAVNESGTVHGGDFAFLFSEARVRQSAYAMTDFGMIVVCMWRVNIRLQRG